MNNFCVLDCTLRDGGYINDFNFGQNIIKNVIFNLSKANLDVVECGFLRDDSLGNNLTLFNDLNQINKMIPKNSSSLFVAMIQLGKYDLSKLPNCKQKGVCGIRLTFHKHEADEAIKAGYEIKNKGYKLFFQPVGTTSYSLQELLSLVSKVNSLDPFAFYIVDTLGVMNSSDIFEFFNAVDKQLNKKIGLGFHSHNNLQLSFSNTQFLFSLKLERTIYVDSSLYGMGRGAGNLNTELICSFLNNNTNNNYNIDLLVQLIDNYIAPLKNKYQWGYSVAYYLSSINNCHPNYATYLLNKKTLTISDIGNILSSISNEKKELFDESLIKKTYLDYINKNANVDCFNSLESLRRIFENKDVLVVAPGKNIYVEKEKILSFLRSNNCIVVGINELNENYKLDYLFVSNKKKLKMISDLDCRLILTSNIYLKKYSNQLCVDYASLSFDSEDIKDNAGLMCLKLLNILNVRNMYLAGFDGFSANDFSYRFTSEEDNAAFAERINSGISKELKKMHASIIFLTKSIYE